jgi:hypothetical protein
MGGLHNEGLLSHLQYIGFPIYWCWCRGRPPSLGGLHDGLLAQW